MTTTLTPPTDSTALEVRSGPHTIAGPGEACLVCGDPLSPGEVYLFVGWDGEAGVAHEDCAEFEAAAAAAESSQGGESGHAAAAGTVAAARDGGVR